MIKKILLDRNKSKRSVDVEKGFLVPLSTDERLLPFDDISDVVNLKEVYDKEKDESDLYRLIFTVNPVCSNVLFNTFTEVVFKEGSDVCTMLTSATTSGLKNEDGSNELMDKNGNLKCCNSTSLNQTQAIRDTEYSHPSICEGLVYHCGIDIFNNHILRNNGFVVVASAENGDKSVFNTIKDYNRDKDGKIVKFSRGSHTTPTSNSVGDTVNLHLYNAENLLTFKEAVRERLIEDDGWFGFTNTSLIDIPNVKVGNDMITVNKVLNNNKSCEFIDMFPDRSLYSFIPKVNKYRNRIEPNWDYCLTYPYKNDFELFQKLNGTLNFKGFQGVRIVSVYETGNSLFMETIINHNLTTSDYVSLYYGDTLHKIPVKLKIVNVGDYLGNNKNRFFAVSLNSLDKKLLGSLYNADGELDIDLFFKKDTAQGECDYYFRLFRKIPNFASSTKNIYDKSNDVEDVIANCKKDYFKNENSKLSFAQNIYGDKSSQILFTDTIDLTRLVDNNGRKLSEIYLTIVKRNKGNKEWYNYTPLYNDPSIEFSRAFGKVTSGLNLGINKDKCFDYNVRRLHNISDNVINSNPILRIPKKPLMIEDDLTIEGNIIDGIKGVFYGDIVERNPETCLETVIEQVYHRFNTAQRECDSSIYSKIVYDVLLQDDNLDRFNYKSGVVSEFSVSERNYGKDEGVKNANIAPEGYFYQPHFRIKVNDIDETISEENGLLINFDTSKFTIGKVTSGVALRIVSPKDYDFALNDVFLFYNKEDFTKHHYWGFLKTIENKVTIKILFEDIPTSEVATILNDIRGGKYVLVKTNTNIPPYAIPSKSLPHKFKWRNVVKPSQVSMGSDILKRPFTNGCHYIHDNINFYLRRQDPFGDYELQYGVRDNEEYNPLIDITPYGDYKDITSHEYYSEDNFNPCVV